MCTLYAIDSVEAGATTQNAEETEGGNRFRPFLGYEFTDDDNLYRLPSDFAALAMLIGPGASRQDHINTLSTGVDGHWILGRQAVDYDLSVDINRYTHNRNLNNTSANGKVAWVWTIGSALSGQVGAIYGRSLAAFADTEFFALNLVKRTDYVGSARYQVGPHWAVYGSAIDTNVTSSAGAERSNNFNGRTATGGVEFATSTSALLAWEYRYTRGHYPGATSSLPGVAFDPDFIERSAQVVLKYDLSDQSSLDARAGYLKRNYPRAAFGTFSGDIWHVTWRWQPTDRTQLSIGGGRDLQAQLSAQSDYFVDDGVELSPNWSISKQWALSATLSRDERRYIGDGQSASLSGLRDDQVAAAEVRLTYTPGRALKFNTSYRYERRRSNQPLLAYDDRLLMVGVIFTY